MRRISIFVSMILLLGITFCFAEGEKITITTYYPAPYGVYNKLQSKKLAVGDTDDDGQITSADLPNRNGDIRLKPQPNDPAIWFSGEEGQFAYSSMDDALYHYNGSDWVKQGGGGGCYVEYGLPTAQPVGAACTVSGFTVRGSAGGWGYCRDGGGNIAHFRPPHGSCNALLNVTIGEAYVCCQ